MLNPVYAENVRPQFLHSASQGLSEDKYNNVICSMPSCPSTTQWMMLCIMTKLSLPAEFRNCGLQCSLCLFTVVSHGKVEAWAFAFLLVVLCSRPKNTWTRVFTGPELLIGFHSCLLLTDRESPPQEGLALIKSSARFRKTWLFV